MTDELCGYIFMGTDEQRHRCTLPANHKGIGITASSERCWCQECKIAERLPRETKHQPTFPRGSSEEEVIQDYIERELEPITCPFCLKKIPYNSEYCDQCGNKLSSASTSRTALSKKKQ